MHIQVRHALFWGIPPTFFHGAQSEIYNGACMIFTARKMSEMRQERSGKLLLTYLSLALDVSFGRTFPYF